MEARHPAAFLRALFDADPERFLAVMRKLVARLQNPPRTLEQHIQKLRQVGLNALANRLESSARIA